MFGALLTERNRPRDSCENLDTHWGMIGATKLAVRELVLNVGLSSIADENLQDTSIVIEPVRN